MLAGGIRSDEQASGVQGVSPHNDQRQKIKAPLGAFVLCVESEHARRWDSKRRASKWGAGRIPYQMFIERIQSDEQASGAQGVFPRND